MVDTRNEKPKVSVMMACFNAEMYIREAIESILNQTFEDIELIIVDDGSDDGSYQICENYQTADRRVKLFKNDKNYGIVYTRNRMLDLANGEYLAVMDADDISLPDRLEKQVTYLDEYKLVGGVSSGCYFINEKSEIVSEMVQPGRTPIEVKAWLLFDNVILNSSSMFRKEVIKKHQLKYRDGQIIMQDYGLWTKFVLYSNWVVLEDKLIKYRELPQSISHNMNDEKKKRATQIENEIRSGYISDLNIKLSEKNLSQFLPIISKFRNKMGLYQKLITFFVFARFTRGISDKELKREVIRCELRVLRSL